MNQPGYFQMDKYLILEIVGGLVLLPVRVGTPP